MILKSLLKTILPTRAVLRIQSLRHSFLIKSIRAAVREQGFSHLMDQLAMIVPDITHQYTTFDIDTEYLKTNVRAMHAFQIYLVNEALQSMDHIKHDITIVDIGDSAGTHIRYLHSLHKDRKIRFLSVNIDEIAVNKIRDKGLEAIHCRAEELASYSINADIFLSFEMLEHLMNPAKFLYDLSTKTTCKALVMTVPYVASSRVGLLHIRNNKKKHVTSENTHIFELSPSDWKLLFMHSGWSIKLERIYLQYPLKGLLRLMKRYWKKSDFEGFYGAILLRDYSWSQLYDGW